MEMIHKINQLESAMSAVAKHLNEPDLLQSLKENQDK